MAYTIMMYTKGIDYDFAYSGPVFADTRLTPTETEPMMGESCTSTEYNYRMEISRALTLLLMQQMMVLFNPLSCLHFAGSKFEMLGTDGKFVKSSDMQLSH